MHGHIGVPESLKLNMACRVNQCGEYSNTNYYEKWVYLMADIIHNFKQSNSSTSS